MTVTTYICTDTVNENFLSQLALCSGGFGFCNTQMMTASLPGQIIKEAGIRLTKNGGDLPGG